MAIIYANFEDSFQLYLLSILHPHIIVHITPIIVIKCMKKVAIIAFFLHIKAKYLGKSPQSSSLKLNQFCKSKMKILLAWEKDD